MVMLVREILWDLGTCESGGKVANGCEGQLPSLFISHDVQNTLHMNKVNGRTCGLILYCVWAPQQPSRPHCVKLIDPARVSSFGSLAHPCRLALDLASYIAFRSPKRTILETCCPKNLDPDLIPAPRSLWPW